MARRTKKNTYLWYGLYAVAGYYAYNWYNQYRMRQRISTPQNPPVGTN